MLEDLLGSDWAELDGLYQLLANSHRLVALGYFLIALHAIVFCTYVWCKTLTLVSGLSERLVRFYWRVVVCFVKPIAIGLLAIGIYKYTSS